VIHIGCSGFRSSRAAYFQRLAAVEVQHTFYQPPKPATLEGWRAEAPEGFAFAIKAWQFITHRATSPTYKRLKRPLTEQEREEAGFFRPNDTVQAAWEATQASARALGAEAVLFQCPASFEPTQENVGHLLGFFGSAEREGRAFFWEPRGGWPPELVEDLCRELDLGHVVDPFTDETVTPDRCYFRLHGRRGWRYSYEDAELEELAGMLPEGAAAYVFFNNVDMMRNAVRFREIVEDAR